MFTRLLDQFLNRPHAPDDPYLADKFGRKFWVYYEGNEPGEIDIYYRKGPVGIIRLIWHKRSVELCDIIIFDRKFRRLGLGSQMFEFLKLVAMKNGKQWIDGIIAPSAEEGVDFASLKSFYQKQGCLIKDRLFVFDLRHSGSATGQVISR